MRLRPFNEMGKKNLPTKTCNTCEETKPIECFIPQKNGVQGVRAKCRACYKKTQTKHDNNYLTNRTIKDCEQSDT